jgi:carbonic anhydrase
MTLPACTEVDPRYSHRLVDLNSADAIPAEWRNTPFEALILSANFSMPISVTGKPELLIATCIDFRYALPIPRMYAYVTRGAGGRLIGSEFSIAYVLSKGVEHVALIAHNDCGMTQVQQNAPKMIEALTNQGWDDQKAIELVTNHTPTYEIDDELDALKVEYERLKQLFPKLNIAPLFVCLADTKLYLPLWYR